LFAYNYDRLGDSIQAKTYIEKYFATAPTNKITNNDLDIAVTIYSKIPGSEATAVSYLQKEIDADTVVANKVKYSNKAADIYGKAKKYGNQIQWLQKAIQLKGGTMDQADYYKLAITAYTGKDYAATMEIAKNYIAAFPDKPQGYYFNVKAAKGIDTGATLGTAVEPILQQDSFLVKANENLAKDTVANKKSIDRNTSILYSNLCYLMGYYNDVQNDVPKAIEACDKILALYPDATTDQNKFAAHIKEVLEKSQSKASGNKPAGNPKP
jgi:tetratricopeptide (TPR) repeat protein